MKSVTYEEFLAWNPCWLDDEDKAAKLAEIGKRKERWTALDVLDLPEEEVDAEDKLWVVLRPELVPEPILHEFACRCAEEALKLVDEPDPRSVAAIEAKRKWLRGEISDAELGAARDAAWAAWYAARDAAWAAWYAARAAARAAARDAARDAARGARAAARDAAWAAWYAARDAARGARAAARDAQIAILRELLSGNG